MFDTKFVIFGILICLLVYFVFMSNEKEAFHPYGYYHYGYRRRRPYYGRYRRYSPI